MLKIYPHIDFTATCPLDGATLNITEVIIPNMRCLANATCPTCQSQYYIDLPIGQALISPITLNQNTAEIYSPFPIPWFSEPLKEGFLKPVTTELIPKIHKFAAADSIILVNCLDNLYGHSLLKLLNVPRYLPCSTELGVCVLVPSNLVHLVPQGVSEIWEFPIPIRDGAKWYPSLQTWIKKQIEQRTSCFLSPVYSHPSHQIYNLSNFIKDLPPLDLPSDQPIILFSYREDRLWGGNLKKQQKNIQQLYHQLLAIFPSMVFIIVGFGHQNQFSSHNGKLIDLRTDKFDIQTDRQWIAYMSRADCAIGIHGSNMLLPSGLAKTTLELVPRSRLGNSVQDLLFPPQLHDVRDALLFYRMLYGNEILSNITPSLVTDLVATLLSFAPSNSHWFKFSEDPNAPNNIKQLSQKPYFQAAKTHLKNTRPLPWLKRKIKRLAEIIISHLD